MKKIIVACVLLVTYVTGSSQELYVYTEPASNMPAKSLSAKLTGKFVKGLHSNRTEQRIMPEIMLGLNKNWMVHVGASFFRYVFFQHPLGKCEAIRQIPFLVE